MSSENALANEVGAVPILLLPAGNDSGAIKPGGSACGILAKARGDKPEDEISVEFKDMVHGWVTRGWIRGPGGKKLEEKQREAIALCSNFIIENS